ncbi:MAG: methylmalonyl Co-A mutase-associated GTPase MeaB, partial [Chloroflexi bacterium]|nr:methylmalonyl Co-A mutase-associated GTPase MeaB [Chloroflexota bacterium]
GSLGGLSKTTSGVVQAFDAANYQIIIIETVGAGQDEVDIARLAHTTLVIEAPGLGDDIQAIKAGIMEIADILVVNKADRPGVENTERALRNNLQLAHPVKKNFQHHGQSMEIESTKISNESIWVPPILRTVATEGIGLPELLEKIAEHREYLVDTGDIGLRERARLTAEFDQRLEDLLLYNLLENLEDGVYENVISDLLNRRLSPSLAAKSLIEKGAK